ncbi:MAG: hypothetical protein Q8N94_11455 [Methanoregula sp.]|nr:hypothetical protein [Methanoregula sp.]
MHGEEGSANRWQRTALLLTAVILVSVLLVPLVSANETGLTRGSRFTITVTGTPNTPYYVWLTRTYTMSGEPGDQPPVLVANQANIEKDPSDGPYVIGSYQYNNGGGRTIIDDVAPTTALISDTQYYALVTTNNDGRAIVAFQTSSDTATRTFSVKVENAQSVAKDNILVQRGDVAVKHGSVVIDTVATLPVRTTVPTPVILPVTETPAPVPTIAVPVPSPAVTPAHRVPVGIWVCIVSVGAVIRARRKSAQTLF